MPAPVINAISVHVYCPGQVPFAGSLAVNISEERRVMFYNLGVDDLGGMRQSPSRAEAVAAGHAAAAAGLLAGGAPHRGSGRPTHAKLRGDRTLPAGSLMISFAPSYSLRAAY